MTQEERAQLRQKISAHMEALRSEIEAHRESSRPVEPDAAIGRITRMEAISARHISEASLQNSSNRLMLLENAMRRIDSDSDFGLCSMCCNAIPVRRLMLMPEATRCVSCAGR